MSRHEEGNADVFLGSVIAVILFLCAGWALLDGHWLGAGIAVLCGAVVWRAARMRFTETSYYDQLMARSRKVRPFAPEPDWLALRPGPVSPPVRRAKRGAFATAKLPTLHDLPAFSNNPLHFGRNVEQLHAHVAHLNEVQAALAEHIEAAIEHYSDNSFALRGQQQELLRLARQANAVAHALEERFPRISSSLANPPCPTLPDEPAEPDIVSSGEMDRRQRHLISANVTNAGRVGRMVVGGDLAGAAVGVVVIGAVNAMSFRRSVRELHDNDAQVRVYSERVRVELEELAAAHRELVKVSAAVHRHASTLQPLLVWAVEAQCEGGALAPETSEPDEGARARLRTLASYGLLSPLHAMRAV